MKKILFLILLFSFYPLSSFSETYDCEIVKWGHSHPSIKTFLSGKFSFNAEDNIVTINEEAIAANVTKNRKTRIEMNFILYDDDILDFEAITKVPLAHWQDDKYKKINIIYLIPINKVLMQFLMRGNTILINNTGKCKVK